MNYEKEHKNIDSGGNIDIKNADKKTKDLLQVIDFFEKVMIEEDMRRYILRLLSSYLEGFTCAEQFYIWTGTGCHGINTKIMMHDESIKFVQDVKIGDALMGDDYKPRIVTKLMRGQSTIYGQVIRVTIVKHGNSNIDPHTVAESVVASFADGSMHDVLLSFPFLFKQASS